jgi:hypothetical protein
LQYTVLQPAALQHTAHAATWQQRRTALRCVAACRRPRQRICTLRRCAVPQALFEAGLAAFARGEQGVVA